MPTLYLVAVLLTAQPVAKEVNLVVTPTPVPRLTVRLPLLPALLDQQPGDCLEYLAQAVKANELHQGLKDAFREDTTQPLNQVDRQRLRANLAEVEKVLALIEKAALATRCDWTQVKEELRTHGLGARLDQVQSVRELMWLVTARARLELLEDRPEQAIRTLSLGFRLAQNLGECPTLISHLVAVAVTTQMLDHLDLVLAHPKTPNLYAALSQLPRPFLSLRIAMEGERSFAYGTFPKLFQFALDPHLPLPTEAEMREFSKAGEGVLRDLGANASSAVARIGLGLMIQAKHATAMKELTASGFPPDRLKQWPPLLVAIVHALIDYEEKLGRMQVAMSLPYGQAVAKLKEIEKELPRGAITPNDPALPLSRLLLPAVTRVTEASARIERRLEALRVVEALRLYAHQKGSWPAALDALTTVPVVPLDPVTGKPFTYRVEGDVAILHGPRPQATDAITLELTYRLKLKK